MEIFRLFVAFTLVCFALSPAAQAVVPPPDGGYPNFTTAEGDHALQHLTAGVGNTAIGTFSLFSVTTGSFNTAIGAGSLDLNQADSNTATGAAALLFNTTGTENTANGTAALEFNDSGSYNTAVGTFALFNNIAGNVNTAVGRHALFSNNTGNSNVAVGIGALEDNISGIENTAIGGAALGNNIDGTDNVAVGQAALNNDLHGSHNVAVGEFAGNAVTTANNVICIGDNMQGQNLSDSCFIANIFNATTNQGSAVYIDANNKLGTLTSSRRFKEDIRPMSTSSEALFSLQPVTFRYKREVNPAGTSQLGLVAEDVEKVNADLVVRDKEGKPYSVRYDQVNAMLLNEFLKEHRKVERMQKQIEALTAGLQKVSAQLELNIPAPRTVKNSE
jgi:trimeric autotransporter adhesin